VLDVGDRQIKKLQSTLERPSRVFAIPLVAPAHGALDFASDMGELLD
jgi:hypothetical protein